MTMAVFFLGLVVIALLTSVGHLALRLIADRWFMKNVNNVWDRETGKGYIPVRKYSTRHEFERAGRRHIYEHPDAKIQFTHTAGRWTLQATIFFVFLPLVFAFIIVIGGGWLRF